MRQLLIIIILITSASFFFTCKKESNPIYLTESAQLSLQVDGEPYCTEVYLQLKAEGIKFPGEVQLVRDSVMIFSHQFDKTGTLLDTLLLDSALLPGTSYHYEARLLLPEGDEVRSRELTVRTMDTTSHNFTWEIFEFGGGRGSSRLFDVAIIDENNIWAVGEIHTPETDRWNEDSTEWIPPYNAVHWDGEQWELLHIAVKLNYGTTIIETNADPIRAIYYNNELGELWMVSSAGGVVKYLDHKWLHVIPPYGKGPGGTNAMWGSSDGRMYFVGNQGDITTYNGSRWEKIESGTDLAIQDIWGEKENIFATATHKYQLTENKVFRISKEKAEEIDWTYGQHRKPYSVWFSSINKMVFCGTGIYFRDKFGNYKEQPNSLTYFTNRVRGTAPNNIFVVGDFGIIVHFNGMTWHQLLTFSSQRYVSLACNENLVIAVGDDGREGQLLLLQKTN